MTIADDLDRRSASAAETIFIAALSPEDRFACLSRASGESLRRRQSVEALLRVHDRLKEFLQEQPAAARLTDQPGQGEPKEKLFCQKILFASFINLCQPPQVPIKHTESSFLVRRIFALNRRQCSPKCWADVEYRRERKMLRIVPSFSEHLSHEWSGFFYGGMSLRTAGELTRFESKERL
jgi:hypothetical protein